MPYSPGELKAVAYQGGRRSGPLHSPLPESRTNWCLLPIGHSLKASRDDLSYVMVQVVDEQGSPFRMQPSPSPLPSAERVK